jgi:uncharacterized protein YkwD
VRINGKSHLGGLLTLCEHAKLTYLKLLFAVIAGCCLLNGCSPMAANTTIEIPIQVSSSTSTTEDPSKFIPSGPFYTPKATPFSPSNTQIELIQYMLGLINADRQAAGMNPVILSYNAAAQKHAQDMFESYYWAHWGTDGLKPYMRYTLEGGLGYDRENVGYTGIIDQEANRENYADIDPIEEIRNLENEMVNNDARSNWGHRDNILYKFHQKVNIGLAFDKKHLALVQQFEGSYVDYYQPPAITGNSLFLSGKISLGKLSNISICQDSDPQPITGSGLINGPYHSYDLGNRLGYIISPPPPGQYYKNLPVEAIQAKKWYTTQSGQFLIEADISPILAAGKGVYTIVIVTEVDGVCINLTNYSIFIK